MLMKMTTTITLDECEPNPCGNGGTCTNSDEGARCACKDGYYGPNCYHGKTLVFH